MSDKKQNLDPDELLASKNFKDIVNVIIFRLGKFDDEIKNDIRQACALAVLKSIEKYDPSKKNNFWLYAMRLMTEYARNELNLHKNIIHIPYNRINSGFKNYENVNYDYEPLTFENGSDIPIYVAESDKCIMLDLQNTIESLGDPASDVVKMRVGLKETKNGKNDFASIGDDINMPMHKVRNLFLDSKKKLAKYLKDYLETNQ